MGLAASQSRMLLLTARKSDIESGMMKISNQKLSLSRQSAEASEDYSNSLNTTRLAWRDGSSISGLSYGLLMTPNSAVSGQYLLTNTANNRILLDNRYRALLPGLGADSGSSGDFLAAYQTTDSFVSAMLGQNVQGVVANSTVQNPVVNNEITTCTTHYNDADVMKALIGTTFSTPDGERTYSNDINSADVEKFAFVELYFGKNDVKAALNTFVGDVTNDIAAAVLNVIKGSGVNYSDEALALLDGAALKAKSDTSAFYLGQFNNADDIWSKDNDEKAKESVSGNNTLSYNWEFGNDPCYLDVNQLIKTFLNYFDAACAELDENPNTGAATYTNRMIASHREHPNIFVTNYIKGQTVRDNNGIGGTSAAALPGQAGVPAPAPAAPAPLAQSYEAIYYANLYAALAYRGWEFSTNVNNQSWLETQILQGNVAISELLPSGYWSMLSTGDADSPLTTESDEEAIAQAEADYQAFKDELDYKESKLDIEMNDLDTERSAIETELDSVQKIINKNIERTFKIFDA